MSPPWKVGDHIKGRWELREEINSGGMGVIYVVVDREDGSMLAAKSFKDDVFAQNAAIADRFINEAIAWFRLGIHPNVTAPLHMDRIDGKPFIFLQYVNGGHLGNWISSHGRAAKLAQVLRFGIQICDGMTFILAGGIAAHRDLKPQNCLLTTEGVLKITDFGIAKLFDPPESHRSRVGITDVRSTAMPHRNSQPDETDVTREPDLGMPTPPMPPQSITRSGIGFGTPAYMAPEQFIDAKRGTPLSDIYSLGVILFEMATGRLPFVAARAEGFADLHLNAAPPRPDCDAALADIINICLAKDPADRFQDFGAIRRRLNDIHQSRFGSHVTEERWEQMPPQMKLMQIADILSVLGLTWDALVHCDKALAINQNDAWALLVKGKCLFALGKTDEAIACLDKSARLDPSNHHVWRIKGGVLAKIGRDSEAVRALDQSLSIYPLDVEVWTLKASSLGVLGRHNDVLECCDRALDLDVRSESAWYVKALTLFELGQLPAARECASRLFLLNPDSEKVKDLNRIIRPDVVRIPGGRSRLTYFRNWIDSLFAPVGKSGSKTAAFYWFNWRVISDAGVDHYGRFAYERILRQLTPEVLRDRWARLVLFDGDCLASMAGPKWYFRRRDAPLLDEMNLVGATLFYVIAIVGNDQRVWSRIDSHLQRVTTTGYVGMTLPDSPDMETFETVQRTMSLVPAARIDGGRFTRLSHGFHTEVELQRFGFSTIQNNARWNAATASDPRR